MQQEWYPQHNSYPSAQDQRGRSLSLDLGLYDHQYTSDYETHTAEQVQTYGTWQQQQTWMQQHTWQQQQTWQQPQTWQQYDPNEQQR